jgi:hypothetical protein
MPSGESVTITDLHLVATVGARGEAAWRVALAIDDALYELAGGRLPKRTIRVDDRRGRISMDSGPGPRLLPGELLDLDKGDSP